MSSSSDSVSLSSSSSESMEFGRSIGRHVEEESTSPAGMMGRIPMETVTEVREDPLERPSLPSSASRLYQLQNSYPLRHVAYSVDGVHPLQRNDISADPPRHDGCTV